MLAARFEDVSLKPIIVTVFILHAIFIFFLWQTATFQSKVIQPSKNLIVKTLDLGPKVEAKLEPKIEPAQKQVVAIIEPEEKIVPQKKELPKTEEPKPKAEVVKKEIVKKPEEKKVTKVTTPAKPKPKVTQTKVKEKTPQSRQNATKKSEILASVQKKIAQIDSTSDKMTSSKSSGQKLPGKIASLQTETLATFDVDNLSSQERSFYEELAARLKLRLRLPEYGDVKIKLTLNKSGKFLTLEVINAKSEKNKKYLETTLPNLSYPTFGKNFGEVSQHTFCINLSNDL